MFKKRGHQESVLAILSQSNLNLNHQPTWSKTWYWADGAYISLCKALIAPLSKIHNMLMTHILLTYICYMIYRQNIVLNRFNSIFKQKGCARTCFQAWINFWHSYGSKRVHLHIGAIYKAPVIRRSPFLNPCMCPPCLFQKKSEFKENTILASVQERRGKYKIHNKTDIKSLQ